MGKNNKNKQKKTLPAPAFQIQINVLSNGSVNVQNFPIDLNLALQVLDAAKNTIVVHFINMAKSGRLNDLNVIDGGNIVVPKNLIFKPQ